MEKIMISQPMRGKTIEQIRAERAELVRELTEKGYEVIDTVFPDINFVPDENGKCINKPVWYLSKSLEAMANVDAVYFMDDWDEARGCRVEFLVCEEYGIPVFMSEKYADTAKPEQIWKK